MKRYPINRDQLKPGGRSCARACTKQRHAIGCYGGMSKEARKFDRGVTRMLTRMAALWPAEGR